MYPLFGSIGITSQSDIRLPDRHPFPHTPKVKKPVPAYRIGFFGIKLILIRPSTTRPKWLTIAPKVEQEFGVAGECGPFAAEPYPSVAGVWQRIGFPGPSSQSGGYPDFDQPQG